MNIICSTLDMLVWMQRVYGDIFNEMELDFEIVDEFARNIGYVYDNKNDVYIIK